MRRNSRYYKKFEGIEEFAYGGSEALRKFLSDHPAEEHPENRERSHKYGRKDRMHMDDWDFDDDEFDYDEFSEDDEELIDSDSYSQLGHH